MINLTKGTLSSSKNDLIAKFKISKMKLPTVGRISA